MEYSTQTFFTKKGDILKVTVEELAKIKSLESDQNKRVFAVGVMQIQKEEYCRNFSTEYERIIAEIKESEGQQNALGEIILKAHGLNIKGRDFKIRADGVILELKQVSGKAEFVEVNGLKKLRSIKTK